MPDRTIAGRDRRLVVAVDHPRRLAGTPPFRRVPEKSGLAKNILTVRLRTLVDQGILKTAPASDGSAYQEYLLTPKGRGIFPILVALRQWSEEFDETPEEIATIMVDRETGKPVRRLALYSQDGRLLGASDTALKPRTSPKASSESRPSAVGKSVACPPSRAEHCNGGHVASAPLPTRQIRYELLRFARNDEVASSRATKQLDGQIT